jgi:hypothetical protein
LSGGYADPEETAAALARDPVARGALGDLGVATSVVLTQPPLWLLGAAAFLLRGGWLLLALPIWILPSPVAVTLFFGADALSPVGPSSDAVRIALLGGGALVLAVLLALVGGALAEIAAFERFVADPETLALRKGRSPRHLARGERLRLATEMATVQGALFLPAALALALSIGGVVAAIEQEYTLPGALDVPLLIRVLTAVQGPLSVVLLLAVLGDLLTAPLWRAVLTGATGLRATPTVRSGVGRIVRRRGRLLATDLTAWLMTLVLVIPSLVAVAIAWGGVRVIFLAPPPRLDPPLILGWAAVTVIFVLLWSATLLLAGISSAVRGALWSAEALH